MFTGKKILAIVAAALCFNANLSNIGFAQSQSQLSTPLSLASSTQPIKSLPPLAPMPQQSSPSQQLSPIVTSNQIPATTVSEFLNAESRYPDYAYEYLGEDKYENFNRKIFNFNSKLNRFAIRPVHIIWASVMPKYGIDRLQSAYANIEYPKRLVSCLIQKDFKGSKNETFRFITNTTIGLGGLYDPADKLFHVKSTEETMEQALAKCKVKPGPYLVIPVISSTSPRDIAGRILDTSLNPTSYIATPVLAIVKAGLLVNRTSYMQPMVKMVESTYADPYDIAKKYYGIENYIKNYNLDRAELLDTSGDVVETVEVDDGTKTLADKGIDSNSSMHKSSSANELDANELGASNVNLSDTDMTGANFAGTNSAGENYQLPLDLSDLNGADSNLEIPSGASVSSVGITPDIESKEEKDLSIKNLNSDNLSQTASSPNKTISDNTSRSDILAYNEALKNKARAENVILQGKEQSTRLFADMLLFDYNPQNPVIDAMRTALFELPNVSDSMWSEISIWNRCFSKQIKTASVNIDPTRVNYNYRYIMQKNKNAPVAIIYPSIGEGIMSHHSVVLAKLFYDEGYSVIIQGSHFQWEFVKSMPKDYRPGIPSKDADCLQAVTSKIVNSLQAKYNCEFKGKVVIGTSFGAMTALFLADKEYKNNTLNITKYISINPPIELVYAMKQVDKNTEEWDKNPGDLKNRVAVTAAKVVQVARLKEDAQKKFEVLPFTEDEAKLITGFIMHQKLSDLIFTIEEASKSQKTDIYKSINNMDYQAYAEKYLVKGDYKVFEDLNRDTSLSSIANYLEHNSNYKIYHTLDDYLVNQKQLRELKSYSGNKVVLINNGSHLGYLYRPEFIDSLKKDIALKTETVEQKPLNDGLKMSKASK